MAPLAALLLASCAGAPADVAKWPWPHRGDVRAVITVAPAELSAAAGGPLAAVVQWRRRDAHPEGKAVIVTDSAGRELGNVTTPVVEQDRGVIVFTPTPGQTTYYVYYMPYKNRIEGARLEALYGDAFRRYATAVPSLLPRLYPYAPLGADTGSLPDARERFLDNNEVGTAAVVAIGVLALVLRWLLS